MNEAVKMLEAIYWAQIENRFAMNLRCLDQGIIVIAAHK